MRARANNTRCFLCVLFILTAGAAVYAQAPRPAPLEWLKIIYVNDDADGLDIGTSWEHAVTSLQDALLLAYFSDKPVEIRVAQGIYTPDRGLGIIPGDRTASFQLINNVTIKGGYAENFGGRHGQLDVRDINLYESILSGDLNADDSPKSIDIDKVEENSYHVVTASEADATAVLDGFTITGSGIGGGSGSLYEHSSGMYNDKSGPTLVDCTFRRNLAAERGAGMYNNDSNPVLFNCTFSENDAPDGGAGMYNRNSDPMLTNCTFSRNSVGGHGGGMYNENSKPVLLNCMFTGNTAGMSGGGMYTAKSVPMLTNCTFTTNSSGNGGGGGMNSEESITMLADCTFGGNSTEGNGGGMCNHSSKLTLLSCIFNGNSALRSGGGLYNTSTSEVSLNNCIFNGNSARDGGGMEDFSDGYSTLHNCTFSTNFAEQAGGGISNIQNGYLTLVNCILWADTPDEIRVVGATGRRGSIVGRVEVTYSDVQNGWTGIGNIDSDPFFVDPENGDFHLKSQGGRWDSIGGSWVVDAASSPCIDAGSPDEPVYYERFPNGDRVNMGAYGGTPKASLSPQLLPYLSGRAFYPTPADGAVDVNRNIILSWIAGLNAVSHNVYFGPDINNMLPISIQQATNEIKPGTLDYGVTYYWRIDEVDSEGKINTGPVWTFTTVPLPPPPKGRGCFLADTPVWVDGKLVQISKVVAGRTIGKVTCLANMSAQIEKLEEHEGTFACYDILLESGNSISVAENHYFMAESGRWISLRDLKAGIKLKTLNGPIGIISVTRRPINYAGKVYNLKVAGSDRYLVGKDAVVVRDY